MTEQQQGILDKYWEEFASVALKGPTKNDDLTYERRIWFAGVVAVMNHVTKVQDIDALVGYVGELVRDMDAVAKREMAAADAEGKPDPEICYDGS